MHEHIVLQQNPWVLGLLIRPHHRFACQGHFVNASNGFASEVGEQLAGCFNAEPVVDVVKNAEAKHKVTLSWLKIFNDLFNEP